MRPTLADGQNRSGVRRIQRRCRRERAGSGRRQIGPQSDAIERSAGYN